MVEVREAIVAADALFALAALRREVQACEHPRARLIELNVARQVAVSALAELGKAIAAHSRVPSWLLRCGDIISTGAEDVAYDESYAQLIPSLCRAFPPQRAVAHGGA